jgi:protein arginine N-methyltransferase 5
MSGTSVSGFPPSFPIATVAGHLSLDDIASAAADCDPNYETPILRLLSTSKSKGYDTVCIPLTNEKWRARWEKMCLSPEDEAEKDDGAERVSEAWRSNPVFLREEVNVTRLGTRDKSSKCTFVLISERADEAENTIVVLSDWLELDSQDEWVRCDAETVPSLPKSPSSLAVLT